MLLAKRRQGKHPLSLLFTVVLLLEVKIAYCEHSKQFDKIVATTDASI